MNDKPQHYDQEVNAINVHKLQKDLESAVDGEVRFEAESKALYATDGSNYRQVPIGVVIPRTRQAVIDVIAVCHRYGAPIVSRGCGTALAGQTCNAAVVIDHSKHLNRIIEIDPKAKTATVEGGTILDILRNAAQSQYNLTYGPDPATHSHCTFGGMLGNNSCGIHSVMAGRTADNVHEMDVLTYDGTRLRVGPTSEAELDRIIAEGGRRGEIYGSLKSIRDRYADLIRKRYPKIPRRVSGYNLDDLLPENGFNVARALVGSESTCVTILEATVRLVHSPPQRALLTLGYPDVYSAGDHIPQIMALHPLGLEGIDDKLIHYMKLKKLHPQDVQLLPDGGGWLLVEFGGDTFEEAKRVAEKAVAELKKSPNPPSIKIFEDRQHEKMIWEIRESGLGATANVPTMPLTWPGWEDAAVPPERVGDYLRDFHKLLAKHNLDAALYGHFGQGCIHCRIDFDLFTKPGIENYMAFVDEASDLVNSYNGSFSGEHGDGQSRAKFLEKMYGPELMHAFVEFKKTWDPDWKMNPGKVINPYMPDQNLRLGADYAPWQEKTYFQFPEDKGSFSQATLRCVGVGKCRRVEDSFMCPSFLVTLDEKDTTRGRAHLLFEMFRGDFIKDRWKSDAVRDALDLCLGCKGCKKECPVVVDMATYKSEFLAHYYKGRLRPRSAYFMGWIGRWALLGSKMPSAANFFAHAPILEPLMKYIAGISPGRQIPVLADETFMQWHKHHTPDNRNADKQVVLYPDAFNNFFYPRTLIAAVLVMEALGYSVIIPPGRIRSPRPLIHYGFLKSAQHELQKMIHQLQDYAENAIPILFCEPSSAAVMRDELPALFPNDRTGQKITQLTHLISEFIIEENIEVPRFKSKAILHAHCHQKAALDPEAIRQVLKNMEIEFDEPQKTCCGMAGSFGFEKEHYDISMKVGELHLLPAVRNASKDTLIVADGFSCRTQIKDGAGRQAMHLAELLLYAMQQNGILPRSK